MRAGELFLRHALLASHKFSIQACLAGASTSRCSALPGCAMERRWPAAQADAAIQSCDICGMCVPHHPKRAFLNATPHDKQFPVPLVFAVQFLPQVHHTTLQ